MPLIKTVVIVYFKLSNFFTIKNSFKELQVIFYNYLLYQGLKSKIRIIKLL